MTAKLTSHRRAIAYAVASFASWVVGDTFMKLAGESKLPFYEVVAFMSLFAALFMGLLTVICGDAKKLWPKNSQAQIIYAVLSLATNVFNTVALKHLTLTLFFVTVFTAPMIVAILAALFLHERLTLAKILAVICGFAGVVIAVNPFQSDAGGDWIGYAAATAGTGCFAINIVMLRVKTQSESVVSLAFFSGCFQTVICLFFMAVFGWSSIGWTVLLTLVGLGLFGVIGNALHYLALRHTTATNVAQFHYTQIITGAFLGYLIWHDVPAWYTWLGSIIIIGSGLYILARATPKQNVALATASIEKKV